MEDTPSKRRKVTPPENVNTLERESAPAEEPTSAKRASWSSWLSPTKASLARFNPKLLPAPSSPPKIVTPRSPVRQRSLEPGALRSPTRPNEPVFRPSPERAASSSPRRSTEALGGTFSVKARRPARSTGEASREASREPGSRPSSAPAREATQAGLDTQLASELEATTEGQRVSISSRPRRPERAEPDLPPTPEHLGLRPLPAQPQGLSSSSPTARASKRKVGTRLSPLKATFPIPEEEGPDRAGTNKENVHPPKEQQPPGGPQDLRKRDQLRRLRDQAQRLQDDVTYLEKAAASVEESASIGFVTENKLRLLLTNKDPHSNLVLRKKPVNPLSAKLSQFLPFSRPRVQQDAIATLQVLEENSLDEAYVPTEAKSVAVDLGVEPNITISSSEHLDVQSLYDARLSTKRFLSIREATGLFAMDVELAVDRINESVTALEINHVSPWANVEFSTWAQELAGQGDLPALGRAFGEFWSLTVLRAKTWARCSVEFASLLHDPTPFAASQIDEDVGILRANTHAHLGRRTLQFSSDGASLLIEWRIELDWTGAASSVLDASCALPASWRDADVRGSFALVGPAFQRMVEDRGVMDAIRIMVKTLLGHGEGDEQS